MLLAMIEDEAMYPRDVRRFSPAAELARAAGTSYLLEQFEFDRVFDHAGE